MMWFGQTKESDTNVNQGRERGGRGGGGRGGGKVRGRKG